MKFQIEKSYREYAQLLATVKPKVIETEEENEFYLVEVGKLMQFGENLSPAQERLLKLLVSLIENFEDQHYQLTPATPLEILTELVTEKGLKQKDLVSVFGSQEIASEVLSGKRFSKGEATPTISLEKILFPPAVSYKLDKLTQPFGRNASVSMLFMP